MRLSKPAIALVAALAVLFGFGPGCGSGNIDLADAPLVRLPTEMPPPESLPKNLRPIPGSSAGMGFDPNKPQPQ